MGATEVAQGFRSAAPSYAFYAYFTLITLETLQPAAGQLAARKPPVIINKFLRSLLQRLGALEVMG